MHPREDDDVPTNPAVVADGDLAGVLDVVAPRLDLGLVRCRQNADVGAEHDALPDLDESAVEDRRVEVEVTPRPDRRVAPVFDDDWGFDRDVCPDAPEDLGLHFERSAFRKSRSALGWVSLCGNQVLYSWHQARAW